MGRYITSLILLGAVLGVVCGLPAPDATSSASAVSQSTISSATPTPIVTPTPIAPPSGQLGGSVGDQPSSSSPTQMIIIIVIFCILPLAGLYFCCGRGRIPCCGRRQEKRNYYNAYPPQGVYLVPVNQFVPPDPKTGYSVRVDTPMNSTELTAATAGYQEHGVIMPPRAASPAGKRNEKNGNWKSMFQG